METKQIIGKVANITPKTSGSGKEYYLFEIEDCPHSFSSFQKLPLKVGEEIEFEYTETPKGDKIYYNFKNLVNEKMLEPPQAKLQDAKRIDNTPNRDYILMLASVLLCVERSKQNPVFLSDKEIYACYENFNNYLKDGLPRETTPESS